MGLVKKPLQLVQLLQGEIGATPPLLDFRLPFVFHRFGILFALFQLGRNWGGTRRKGDQSRVPDLLSRSAGPALIAGSPPTCLFALSRGRGGEGEGGGSEINERGKVTSLNGFDSAGGLGWRRRPVGQACRSVPARSSLLSSHPPKLSMSHGFQRQINAFIGEEEAELNATCF